MNILVTGGTTFVSKAIAEYFSKDNTVYVLNRNTKQQLNKVILIEADRNSLNDKLKKYTFDVVIDVTSYNKNDVENIVNALDNIKEYIFISSSAIYPETLPQPFKEEYSGGYNSIWKDYGINKLAAEEYLINNINQAYIIRPPYLYGPYNNIYREAFVFDCAINNRPFYIPNNGNMKLQFFYIYDLCRFIEKIIELKPKDRIYNVGNDSISIKEWVDLCYKVTGNVLNIVNVSSEYNQREYFPFYDYEYKLDTVKQKSILSKTTSLYEGLIESYKWYINNQHEVKKKNYFDFIDIILSFKKLYIINKTGNEMDLNNIQRIASRAIIIKDNKILMIKSTTRNEEYKFPGGGKNKNEGIIDCLIREVKEEAGRVVKTSSIKPYGYVIEERMNDDNKSFNMKSYYFLCDIEDDILNQHLDEYEEEYGYRPFWVTIDDAIINNENIKELEPWSQRELLVLKHIKEHYKL